MLDAFEGGEDTESDLPPWAVPGGIEPLRPARRPPRPPVRAQPEQPADVDVPGEAAGPGQDRPARLGRRPGRSRAAAARRRRSKRRLVTWGGAVVVIAALVAGVRWLAMSPAPKSPFVTTLQHGEYRQVPDACKVIAPAGLHHLLNGTPKSIQPYKETTQSACTFQVDAQPTFRVLNMTVIAYQASLTASGNGSAAVSGLGSEALSAVQIFRAGQESDRVTVVVRYRNVLITASLQAQETGGFGPVAVTELRSGALAAARTMLNAVRAEQTVS